MPVVYLCGYLFFGWLMLNIFASFLKDYQELAVKEKYGPFRKFTTEFITFGLFGGYVYWALSNLSAVDWSFVNR